MNNILKTSEPLGLGLLGCGAFGRFCLEQYQGLPGVKPVAVADVKAELAQATAAQFRLSAEPSPEALLGREDVRIVHIATPPTTHYALVLQARIGRLSSPGLARGLAGFARSARFGVDLTRTHEARVLNNTAPMVMQALDEQIREASGGRRSLDDAVRAVASAGGTVTTARFLRATSRAAGRDLTPFFRRHVLRGEAPAIGH